MVPEEENQTLTSQMEASVPSAAATAATAPLAAEVAEPSAAVVPMKDERGSARHVRMDAPAANDNDRSNDDSVNDYHDERSDHFLLKSTEVGRSDSATHADAIQGGKTASFFRLPNGQLISAKNTIPSDDNRVDANQGHGGKGNLYRLPNGQEVTAKNTLQSHDGYNRRRQQVDNANIANIPIPIFVDAQPQSMSVRDSDDYNPLTSIVMAQAAVENETSSTAVADHSNGAHVVTTHQKGHTRLAAAVIAVGLLVTVAILVTLRLTGSDAPTSEPSPSQSAANDTVATPSQSGPILPSQPSSNGSTSKPTLLSLQLPTPAPTLESRAMSLTNFINGIKLSNGTLAVPQSPPTFILSTPAEEAALAWLVYDDPLQLSPGTSMSEFRLQQRYALLTLFLQVPDFLTSNGVAESECQWLYLSTCTFVEAVPHVTEIHITSLGLTQGATLSPGATLPPDLGLLTDLESFALYRQSLKGRLPSSLGATWTNLQYFDLSGNDLTGSLPSLLGTTWTNLTTFDVSYNALSSSLPASLGTTWTNLEQFAVNENQLTGSLLSSWGTTWTNLTRFDVSRNSLTGTLPFSLGTTWTNLQNFHVSFNALTGSVPSSLGTTWTNLEWFSVNNNALMGTIPNILASQWTNLQYASFANNSLVGSIPNEFCTIAALESLYADCTEVNCSCCTYCCSDATGECCHVASGECCSFATGDCI